MTDTSLKYMGTLRNLLYLNIVLQQELCRQVRDLEELDVSQCVSLSDQAIKVPYPSTMTDMAIQYLTGVGHYLGRAGHQWLCALTDRTAASYREAVTA
ncbi:hypothetical protein DPEC_G00362180 [Dallia pectoralis]|nr:hypothetical protein DPEC_G00362180 [Dallia pectoralis]